MDDKRASSRTLTSLLLSGAKRWRPHHCLGRHSEDRRALCHAGSGGRLAGLRWLDDSPSEEEGETVGEGGRSTVRAELRPGEYDFYCSVPRHRQGGMQGTLTVR